MDDGYVFRCSVSELFFKLQSVRYTKAKFAFLYATANKLSLLLSNKHEIGLVDNKWADFA